MFAVCNYLEISDNEHITDGFVVEDCGEHYEELYGYFVVCREHRVTHVFDWAKMNMGVFFTQFEKQFKINQKKAMRFIASNGKIASFTEEYVESCGGVEKFKQLYCYSSQPEVRVDTVVEEEQKVSSAGALSPQPESQHDPQPESKPVMHTRHSFIGDTVEHPKPQQPIMTQEPPSEWKLGTQSANCFVADSFNPVDVTEPEPQLQPAITVSEPESQTEPKPTMQSAVSFVDSSPNSIASAAQLTASPESVLFNSDGSFKGFKEGQIVNMLQQLRELDNRIALDTLNPDNILNEEEIRKSAELIDTLAPSVFKGFILDELKHVKTESDFIRVTSLLNNFSSYIVSLNT